MQLPSVPGLFRRLTLIRSVIKRQRKIVYQHFKDYKELLFAKSSKKCIRRRKFLNLVELFGFVIFEKKKKQLLRKEVFEKIKFDNIKIKSSFFINIPLFRNVTTLQASSIFLYIFIPYYEKDKRFKSERNFEIFKKKNARKSKEHESVSSVNLRPTSSPPLIQLPSHRDYQRGIETGKQDFRCNDLIEANRIEASRS